jgi:hypothetical protein
VQGAREAAAATVTVRECVCIYERIQVLYASAYEAAVAVVRDSLVCSGAASRSWCCYDSQQVQQQRCSTSSFSNTQTTQESDERAGRIVE